MVNNCVQLISKNVISNWCWHLLLVSIGRLFVCCAFSTVEFLHSCGGGVIFFLSIDNFLSSCLSARPFPESNFDVSCPHLSVASADLLFLARTVVGGASLCPRTPACCRLSNGRDACILTTGFLQEFICCFFDEVRLSAYLECSIFFESSLAAWCLVARYLNLKTAQFALEAIGALRCSDMSVDMSFLVMIFCLPA